MATITSNKSPMHINCTIGQPYGNPGSYTCGFHTGIDFPETGTGETNPDLYSCVEDGEVVYIYTQCLNPGDSPALGNQVLIKDNRSGYYFRYCHMLYGSIVVNVGEHVTTATRLGKMGNTGNSTGTHLHLECTRTIEWRCDNFLNPGEILGFGNERGTIIVYDGTTPPIPPTPVTNKKKYNTPLFFLKRLDIYF